VHWHQWVVPNGTWDAIGGTAILPALCDSGTVEEIMGCLFAVFAGFFPRLAVLFIWIARPQLFTAAFGGSWFIPLLGILILPFTTLMWAILWSPAGMSFWDWLWIILAAVLDLGHLGSTGYANKERLPMYQDTNP